MEDRKTECTLVIKGVFLKDTFNLRRCKGFYKSRPAHVTVIPGCFENIDGDLKALQAMEKHENILQYFYCEERSHEIILVSDPFSETNLTLLIKNNKLCVPLKKIALQVTHGLEFLHRSSIVHANLKPSNIFVNNGKGTIKLCDFGMLATLKQLRHWSLESDVLVGVFDWMSPEEIQFMMNNNGETSIYAISSDIFSLGCVLYYVISNGFHPFGNIIHRTYNILKNKKKFSVHEQSGKVYLPYIHYMLSSDPQNRPTGKDILNFPILWSTEKTVEFIRELRIIHNHVLSEECDDEIQSYKGYIGLLHKNIKQHIPHHLHVFIKEHYKQTSDLANLILYLYYYQQLSNWTSSGGVCDLIESINLNFMYTLWIHNQHLCKLENLKQYFTSQIYQVNPAYSLLFELQRFTYEDSRDIFQRSWSRHIGPYKNFPFDPLMKESEWPAYVFEPTVGIYLGNQSCCVKFKPQLAPYMDGPKLTPAYVAILEDGTEIFGEKARNEACVKPGTTIYNIMRMIGRTTQDKTLEFEMQSWPFDIRLEGGTPKLYVAGKLRHPQEILARLLRYLRNETEKNFASGCLKHAVITVASRFTQLQRRAAYQAGVCGGFKIQRMLSEPAAIALALKVDRSVGYHGTSRNLLFYSFCSEAISVWIAEANHKVVRILSVAEDSNPDIPNIDELLMDYCIVKYGDATGINLALEANSQDAVKRHAAKCALESIRLACEEAKSMLPDISTNVVVPEAVAGKPFSVSIDWDVFNNICKPIIHKSMQLVTKTLETAKARGIKDQTFFDDIVLVGKGSILGAAKESLRTMFPDKLVKILENREELVANGVAIYLDNLFKYNVSNVVDVIPQPICIICPNDIAWPILAKHTPIPCSFTQEFHTSEDNQTSFRFIICEGEHMSASQNETIGEFVIDGIKPAPKHVESIWLSVKINRIGLLKVAAFPYAMSDNEMLVTSIIPGMTDEEVSVLTKELSNKPHTTKADD